MSGATAVAGTVQIVGGIALAPLLPGLVQHWKARLQGRRGPTPLQPYRELRRLWGKSAVTPEGASILYRLAPSVVGAAVIAAVLVVPVAATAPSWGVGHDALLLVGLLALARFAVVAAAWDVGSGFSLIGASRDLTLSVFVEATLVLSLAVAALLAETTDLRGVVAATAGTEVWTSPALALGALAFALVAVAETGRQPVDSPDTHLELTMIHEGPLLEYAGRDLAYLQWAAAARHWLVLVLAAQVFLPHPRGRLVPARRLARRPRRALRGVRARRDARREDARPARTAAPRCRHDLCTPRHRLLARELVVSGAVVWTLVALGLAVLVVRRRSLAVALVTAQALVLVGFALDEAESSGDVIAAGALAVRAVVLAGLFLLLVSRTRAVRPVRARVAPLARAGIAVAFALALTWLVPAIGLVSRDAERGVLALVAFGIATAALRRATLFQIIGIVLVENALALAALQLPGGASVAIELGVALDLMLVAVVAVVFYERIFAEFGTADSAALRALRD